MTSKHKIWIGIWILCFLPTYMCNGIVRFWFEKKSLGTNSSMFVNCLVFCDVWHIQSLVLSQNVMFGSVRSSVLLLCDQTSFGTNSLMFSNCSVFCDVRHVWSSVLGQNVMFGSVRSLVLLLCDQTSLGTYSLMFAKCSVFCDVWHVWSSIWGQNMMLGKFDVWTFNVRSVGSSVFWCSLQD